MRATSTPSPVRHGRHRLLESCAIAASLIALAHGGPSAAQVAGSGTVVTLPSGATNGTGVNPSTVNVAGDQTIINWTPSNTPVDGVIDFLPSGNTLNFVGDAAGYTVLNRFISASGTSINDQVALNGTVNGYVGSTSGPRGGNIWFYNAGGILIGNGAAINVGSLLLTANEIDTADDSLFGAGGEIRFRGVASTSTVEIAPTATINALTPGNPGGSYVALVAPRIVQRGTVTTDGSTAYVAAEQADIRINNGLFDINVTVGAADGDVITHSGVTTGPAHQQGDTDQNRIYMVAIPKNDAVTMLVSGQIGYDDALSAQVDPDGAVRLSAGYNIVDGEFAATPVAGGTGNITVNDTLFRSDVVAHASGAFVGRPLSDIPPPIFDTPDVAHVGRISAQGNATFLGDESTTITIGANRSVDAGGDLIIQAGNDGITTVNVDGGRLFASGNLSILANGVADAATGDSRGGTAALNVSNGGSASAVGTVTVAANGIAGRDATGAGGDGRGGTATITVTGSNLATGVASRVAGNTVVAEANGVGGGLEDGGSGIFTASDQGGNGNGGNVTISVQDGASLTATDGSVIASANGSGQIGNLQSGNGTGGRARIEVAGAGSVFDTPTTTIDAFGAGGGSISDIVIGTIPSQGGGSGRGGSATLSIAGDATTAINPGTTSLNVTGSGGGAVGAENVAGGNAVGGTATVEASGLVAVTFPSLSVTADGLSGGASSPSLLTGQSGNATGGTINVTADNGATLTVDTNVQLLAAGIVAFSENLGNGLGGNVTVSAEDAGTIDVAGGIGIDVSGGGFGTSISESGGSGTGGTVNLLAARSGVLTASRYDVLASGLTANVRGTGGPAQGGFVNIEATAGGRIAATDISLGTIIDASALSGISADGSVAGGGTIQITAGGGSIDFNATTFLQASGVSGGATNAGSSTIGNGGVIQIQVLNDAAAPSSISFGTLQGGADGLTAVDVESAPGIEQSAGDGQGGTMTIDIAGGSFTANAINLTADGYGGGVGTASGVGRGGTASYTQTGGTVTVGDMAISANGFGGFAPDVSGQGLGGQATIELLGGTLTAGDIVALAVGVGGDGAMGNDFDPAGAVPSGNGGEGQGGVATITIDGATVDANTLAAYATGSGGTGGIFVASSFGDPPGDGGDGGTGLGGTATVTVVTGTVTAAGILSDAAGIGGDGGTVFASSSSGVPVGTGVGGNGGEGRGGEATIDFTDAVTVTGDITSTAAGIGGSGGGGFSGGNGGLGTGGLAQAIVTGFDAGTLAVIVDSSASGGNGADGSNGVGGRGGDARGGTARIETTGAGASATVGQENFVTEGVGGNGGNGAIPLGATPAVAPRGGDGGTGEGGVLEVVASGGATALLAPDTSGAVALGSRGTGGDAGNGSAAAFPDGSQGGDGGNGGGAIGGTVHLAANGGTITSNGVPVDITVDGTAGVSGSGGAGTGTGADGAGGSSNGTTGGRVSFEAFSNPGETGQITLGDTTIAANGDSAGRIEMRAEGTIAMTSQSAEALGLAPPTNLDTDTAGTGIFMAVYGDTGTVTTTGAMSLDTGSSIGVHAQAGGTVAAGGDLTMQAADEIDIRHDFRTGTAPTIAAGGAMSINAAVSIRAQTDSLLSAGTSLLLNAFAANGGINVDGIEAGTSTLILSQNVARVGSSTSGDDLTINSFLIDVGSANAGDDISIIGNNLTLGTLTTDGSGLDSEIDGSNIFLQSAAATTVTHAEAGNDFTAVVGSFQTGLNSIITGGDIIVNSPGAVDLGNSTAGGFVSVNGQSIAFNAIDAGSTVFLTATGTVPGAAGIGGVSIDAGDNISLNATEIGITGTVASGGSIVANGSAGAVAIGTANADDTIFIEATGDINGAYNGFRGVSLNAGGDIAGSASATGFESSSSGTPIAASVFVDAGGDVTLTSGNAAGMYGVNAGGSATLTGVSAGEDLFVRAGTTANLTNLTAGDDLTVQAPGTITAAGLLTTGTGPDNQSIDYSTGFDVVISSPDGSNIVLTSTGGNVAANSANAFDNLTVTAAGTLSSTGLLQSGQATSLTGNLVNLTAVTAGTDIGVNSASAVSATGALAAGHDVTVVAAANVNIAELDAGDDVSVDAGGTAQIGAAYSYGSGLDNEGNGSNIAVDAQSITFDTLDAASTVNLTATGTAAGSGRIDGATVIAGSDINMNGNSIAITDSVTGAANFFAIGSGGTVAVASADVSGTISIFADGNLTGTYVAGGNIFLDSGASITASATANGGNLFVDAAGNATLTNSGAASMFGVNAGQAAAVTGGTAGEDLLIVAGTTANLSNVTAGDDITVRANGAITAQGVSTTGAGIDSRALTYSTTSGFTIASGEGTSATDGADIVMASASGAINAGGLSAGDDILLTAATALTLNGATTLGLGVTGGDSSIRTQSASAVLGGLAAASDVVVDASGAVAVNSSSTAGRDVIIDAASANIAVLTNPGGDPIDTLAAGRDLSITTAGAIAGGALRAGRDMTLSAGSTIDVTRAATGAGGALSLDAAAGITAAALSGGGATSLTSDNGAILVGNLASAGPVTAIGDSLTIDGSGNLIFGQLQATAGGARVTTGGNLAVTAGTVAGEARLTAGGNLAVTQLDAGNAILASNGTMTLGTVAADDILSATAQSLLTVNGAVTGRTMSLASADIAIASAGRVGNGTTESLELRNIDNRVQTFIGGTGTQNGYHIDSDELTRVYGSDIRIFAPAVDRSGGRFIGTLPPDVVIDDFTMTAGSPTSNLGANGSLTIATPGTVRVVGDVALTGMGDNNALNIFADQSIEVIMGDGSIRLSGSSSTAPAGQLNLVSEDVIVATLAAIDDVAAAGSTDAIEDRLAQNDGITSDEGAIVAGGINVGVSGGFYVQNSGGSDFGERRGLTFGALGLNVDTAGPDTRIVINGVHLGPSGQVTGIDTIPLLTINGVASGSAPANAFDQRSRFNGCLIANTGACATVPEPEYHNSFPVQDVIEEEVDDNGDGMTLPQSLITMRDLDPLTGEPLLDDPVTGAGNDDLWTPPTD